MIILKNLSLNLGGKVIFNDISLTIAQDHRIALVGKNGSGKTTLLKVISGQQALDFGQVSIEKRKTVAYLPQEVVLASARSILDETLSVYEDVVLAKTELKAHEESLIAYKNNPEKSLELIERIAELQYFLVEHDFDQLVLETKKMLQGLGFLPTSFDQPVATLSVGWKMRIVLAKLLLQKADFYIFDEPTNHLDILAKDWLLGFLQQSTFGFMLVCHDRLFLDKLCPLTFELDRGRGKLYRGNYSSYLETKEKELEAQEVAYAEQQREIKHKMEIINKFRAKASKASTAQSMLRALEKIELVEIVPPPPKIKLNFSAVKQPGKIVLKVHDIAHAFEKKQLFKNVSFELVRGDKAAIVASNGVGKTTLLNIIMGAIRCQHGTIERGHNVSIALFEQDQDRVLDKKKTVYEEVESACTTQAMRMQIRPLLGSFLFSGDDVDKKIGVLSGGERNRVAMVKVLLQHANVLILDEPTNHLDIDSKDILLKALGQFPGTILFVSHDHTFLNGLATRILELSPSGVVSFSGYFDSYHYQKEQQEIARMQSIESTKPEKRAAVAKPQAQQEKKSLSGKELYEIKKKMESIERKMETLEKKQADCASRLESVVYGSVPFAKIFDEMEQYKKDISEALAQWEDCAKSLENQ